jgi:mutual gliding-motility protein MglA
VKIVYDGAQAPPQTQNLEFIHAKTKNPDPKGIVSLRDEKAKKSKGLSYSYLPLSLGEIRGFKTRFHLYTTIVGAEYSPGRQEILKGVDGVIFVADSDPAKMKDNQRALAQLKTDLAAVGFDFAKQPVVVQLVNRTHPKALAKEKLVADLGLEGRQVFEVDPVAGSGVFESLKAISKLSLMAMRDEANK